MVLWSNFDDLSVFEELKEYVSSLSCLNFVLEFNPSIAKCAVNLKRADFNETLSEERLDAPRTRWINIWAPEKQKSELEAIASHYRFSPRLLGLMKCDPLTPVPAVTESTQNRSSGRFFRRKDNKEHEERETTKFQSSQVNEIDMEKAMKDLSSSAHAAKGLDLNHYKVINDVWYYCSVDWGRKYLCIGYNSLHNTVASMNGHENIARRMEDRPAGKRVWTWLILCDDATVISVHENPYPQRSDDLGLDDSIDLKTIRGNLLNVYKQLSKSTESARLRDPVLALPIRFGLEAISSSDVAHVEASDSPSLLFYYLFDDWRTSYGLVSRNEHQYGAHLENLRSRMFSTAELGHIDELHHYGRQLAVLKRIYSSYDIIIDRVLAGMRSTQKGHSQPTGLMREHEASSYQSQTPRSPQQEREGILTPYGVSMSIAASKRFERLKDRINLFALSEIQDCIDEKEALVLLNFNLIAIKQSSAVDRLTRITILLAKVSILFMPVSLMTAYFTVQLATYTTIQYWVAFAVIFASSILFLVVFGQMSGTQEAKPIYKSFTRTYFDASKNYLRSKSGRGPRSRS